MGRYLLFVAPRYYPSGGMKDFVGSYNQVWDAMKARDEHVEKEEVCYPECHIYDTVEGCIILIKDDDENWEPYRA